MYEENVLKNCKYIAEKNIYLIAFVCMHEYILYRNISNISKFSNNSNQVSRVVCIYVTEIVLFLLTKFNKY